MLPTALVNVIMPADSFWSRTFALIREYKT